jgi:hypothetical protein
MPHELTPRPSDHRDGREAASATPTSAAPAGVAGAADAGWRQALELLFEHPGDAAALAWGRSHLQFAASGTFRCVLTRETAETWLDCSLLRHPYFTVVLGDQAIPLPEVSSTRAVEGHSYDGFADGEKIRQWFARGATLSIGALHDWHPPTQRLCRELGRRLSANATASVFWTAAGASGLRVHRDDAQVFIVQIAGTKTWQLYDTPAAPGAWQPGYVDLADLPAPTTLELRPGQALYLPEGLAHSATAQHESSIHVTLAIREPNLRDVMLLAVNACLASVPKHAVMGGSVAAREHAARELIGRLARALDRIDVAGLVVSAGRRASRSGAGR